MKVLISEGDWIYRERIVELQNQVAKIRVLLENPDALSIISTIQKNRPDVLILGTQFTNGNILDVLKNIDHFQFIHRLVIVDDPLFPEYQEKLEKYKLTYINNTLQDFRKVIGILVDSQKKLEETKKPQEESKKEKIVPGRGKKYRRQLIWYRNPGERLMSRY